MELKLNDENLYNAFRDALTQERIDSLNVFITSMIDAANEHGKVPLTITRNIKYFEDLLAAAENIQDEFECQIKAERTINKRIKEIDELYEKEQSNVH